MSSEKKTFRIPTDIYDDLASMEAAEEDMTESKCAIRAMQRGLAEYGYGDWSPDEEEDSHWIGGAMFEAAKALAFAGIAFWLSSISIQASAMVFAAGSLAIAAVLLVAERHASSLAGVLGLPDTPPKLEEDNA